MTTYKLLEKTFRKKITTQKKLNTKNFLTDPVTKNLHSPEMSLRQEPNGKGFLLIMYDELKVLNNPMSDQRLLSCAAVRLKTAAEQIRLTSDPCPIPIRVTRSGLSLNNIFVKIQNPLDFDWRNDLMEIENILTENFKI